MKRVLAALALIAFCGCGRQESDYEKLQKTLTETQRDMQKISLSAKLTTSNIPSVKDDEELKKICESIMAKVGEGDWRSAFDEIGKYSPYPKSAVDAAYADTQKQLDVLGNHYGKFVGYEYVGERQLSDSLAEYIYIAKCESHPLPWHFLFYRPKDKWILDTFHWDDKTENIRL